jgi:hypothetical protein
MPDEPENDRQNEPEQDDWMIEPLEEQIEKGGCLRLYLFVAIVMNLLTGLFYFIFHDKIQAGPPKLPDWTIYLVGALSLLNAIFCFAVWKLKKFGVHGFIIVGLVGFALNLKLGLNVGMAIAGLLGPVIMVILVRPIWRHMD